MLRLPAVTWTGGIWWASGESTSIARSSTFSSSATNLGETGADPPRLLPAAPTLGQYAALFTRLDLARHFFNSALITLAATVGSVLINSMAGYAFAKLTFPGRDRTFRALTSAMVIS